MKKLLSVILTIVIVVASLVSALTTVSAGNLALIGSSGNTVDSSSFESLTAGDSLLIPFNSLDTTAAKASDQLKSKVGNTLTDFTTSSSSYGYWLVPNKAMGSADTFGFASWEQAAVAANPKSDSVNSSSKCVNLKCIFRAYTRRIDGLQSGKKYTVSFKYYGTTDAKDIRVGLASVYDTDIGAGSVQLNCDAAWHTKSFTITWTGGSTGYLQFKRSGSTATGFYIDDLSVNRISVAVTASVAEKDVNYGSVVNTTPSPLVGDTVTVSALPNTGSTFNGWYVNNMLVSTNANYSFVVSSDVALVAHFGNPNLIGNSVNTVDTSTFEGLSTETSMLIPFNAQDTSAVLASEQLKSNLTNTLSDFTTSSSSYGYWLVPFNAMNGGDKFGFAPWEQATAAANPKSDSVNSSSACLNLNCISRAYVRRVDGLESGKRYTVSFKYYGTADAKDIRVGLTDIYDTNIAMGTVNFDCDGSWHTKSFTVTWPGSSTGYLQFKRNGTSPVPFYVDDISICKTFTVSAASNNNGGIASVSQTTAFAGESVTFTASPNQGYQFGGWYQNDVLYSTSLSFTEQVTKDISYVAKFEAVESLINLDADSAAGGIVSEGSSVVSEINAADVAPSTSEQAVLGSKVYNITTNAADQILYSSSSMLLAGKQYDISFYFKVAEGNTMLTTSDRISFRLDNSIGGNYIPLNKAFTLTRESIEGDKFTTTASTSGFDLNASAVSVDAVPYWQKITASFTPDSNTTAVLVIQPNIPGTIYIDQISVTCAENATADVQAAIGEVGKAIRTSGTQALRFKSFIDKVAINQKYFNTYQLVEYGTVCIKTEYLNGSELVYRSYLQSDGTTVKTAAKGVAYSAENNINIVFAEDDTAIQFTAALTGIVQANYNTPYSIRTYAVLKRPDGTTFTIYDDSTRTATAYGVANLAYNAIGDNAGYAETATVRQYLYDYIISKANFTAFPTDGFRH